MMPKIQHIVELCEGHLIVSGELGMKAERPRQISWNKKYQSKKGDDHQGMEGTRKMNVLRPMTHISHQ